MAKAKKPLGYKQMPKEDALRVGIKVSWRYYRSEEVAREAAKIAVHNAEIDASLGYDFGYQSPGSVRKMPDNMEGTWAEYNGLWEVCES